MSNPVYVQEYNAIVEVMKKYNKGSAKADSAIMKPAVSEIGQAYSFAEMMYRPTLKHSDHFRVDEQISGRC